LEQKVEDLQNMVQTTPEDKIKNEWQVRKCQEILKQLKSHPFGPITEE
jgi:hypothetical protein